MRGISLSPDKRFPGQHLLFIHLSLISVFAVAQGVERLDEAPQFESRVTQEIYDSAGPWRQDIPAENEWRARKDETVNVPRIKTGADSAYEEMRYRRDDRFRTMGSEYDDLRPSAILKFKF